MSDPTVIKHVSGSFTAGTVNGAGQTGSIITVGGLTGTLNQGDIITIAGVNAVNYTTKQSLQTPRQFTVLQPVASGATTIQVYPAITPYTVTGGITSQTAYQTVDTSPANGAAITLVTKANEVYRKNILFAPKAFTMATADLPLPGGVQAAARSTYNGVSMRMVQYYTGNSDQFTTRLDILFGSALLRPEWVVGVGDAV